LGLWARLLQKDKRFRLLLKFKGGDHSQIRDYYLGQFGRYGVMDDRVRIDGWKSQIQHMASYNDVDIALDTYPYNGTTTCEVMWMGVPTLTLSGKHHASRVGYSILHRLGLEPFVATCPDEFLNKAEAFAGQTEHLTIIRRALCTTMPAGSLCDTRGLARSIEGAFRQMWLDRNRKK